MLQYILFTISLFFNKILTIVTTKWYITILISVTAFFAPVIPCLSLLISIIFVDFFTGIWKARRLKQKITSFRMRDSITKMVLYSILILLGFSIETIILSGHIPLLLIVAGLIIVVEFYSIIENVEQITGKKTGLLTVVLNIKKWLIGLSKKNNTEG